MTVHQPGLNLLAGTNANNCYKIGQNYLYVGLNKCAKNPFFSTSYFPAEANRHFSVCFFNKNQDQ